MAMAKSLVFITNDFAIALTKADRARPEKGLLLK